MSESTFTFELSTPIEVQIKSADGGDTEYASEIVFKSPTSKNLKECAQLKQAFAKAMVEAGERATDDSKAETDKKVEDITGSDVMQALSVSSVELEVVWERGMRLLTSGVGNVVLSTGDDKPLSGTVMRNVSVDDIERMVGEYAVFFILKSFLS